jgi:hypothetical protein
MNTRRPKRDPGAAHARKVRAASRFPPNAKCVCGESRPETLISGSNPTICAAYDRERKGKSTLDEHHPFGRANSDTTIAVSVNDHRAELSPAQYDWPKETLENRERSPLLAGAAGIRGCIDMMDFVIRKGLLWIAEGLEWLDPFLRERLGPRWWIGTWLEQFAPKPRKHGNRPQTTADRRSRVPRTTQTERP